MSDSKDLSAAPPPLSSQPEYPCEGRLLRVPHDGPHVYTRTTAVGPRTFVCDGWPEDP